jgi:hypothetical protein
MSPGIGQMIFGLEVAAIALSLAVCLMLAIREHRVEHLDLLLIGGIPTLVVGQLWAIAFLKKTELGGRGRAAEREFLRRLRRGVRRILVGASCSGS